MEGIKIEAGGWGGGVGGGGVYWGAIFPGGSRDEQIFGWWGDSPPYPSKENPA